MKRLPTTTISRLASAAGIAAGVLPLLVVSLGAGVPGATGEQASRQRIHEMSQVQRDRLRSNYETFLALPAVKQDAYRQIRRAVEEDDRQGGQLRRVVRNYHQWLKTLSLWQRDELRQETDARARMKLVRRFCRQQQQETERQRLGLVGGLRSFPRLLVQPVPTLSSVDFNAMMQTLQHRTRFRTDEGRKLKKLVPPLRHLKLLMIAAPKRRRGASRYNWPHDDTVAALIAAITDTEIREQLSGKMMIQKTLAGITDPVLRKRADEVSASDWRRYFLARMILQALRAEWRTEFNKRKPTEQQTEEFFESLSKRQQNEIISRSGYAQKRQLTDLYMQKHHPELARGFRELRRLIPRLIPMAVVRALYQHRRNGPKGRSDSTPGHRPFRKGDRSRRKSIPKSTGDRRPNPGKSGSGASRD